MLDPSQVREIVERVRFRDWEFVVSGHKELTLQIQFMDQDIVTGNIERQYCREWILPTTTVSDVVRTCFKAVQAAMEHETCEHFKYRGKSIYNPHIDVDALHEAIASKRFDLPSK